MSCSIIPFQSNIDIP